MQEQDIIVTELPKLPMWGFVVLVCASVLAWVVSLWPYIIKWINLRRGGRGAQR